MVAALRNDCGEAAEGFHRSINYFHVAFFDGKDGAEGPMRKRTLKKCESCLRCGDPLNDAPHSNRSRPNPLRKTSTWCIFKSCLQKAKRATRDREKAREYSQQFAVENWHRTLANACARRARDAGLACEINHEAVSEMFEAQEGGVTGLTSP